MRLKTFITTLISIALLLSSCQTPHSKSKRFSNELKGCYKLKIQNSDDLLDSLKQEGDFAEKLFGSLATLLQVKVCFQDNNHLSHDTLFLDDANINDDNFIILKKIEQGIFLAEVDSNSFLLIPE